ncbi:uncharacterized protein H6S33_007487 [Morchella sextelata]|uniref:uncharacterized protein n=1 Tax=Morchella sextelata TaxID=1174677 RepID=UPI001D05538C|nr:uncharacterized protein H6S33_007487 [Morchella sextelata]KAH0603828.1 hypothetical protein H6S33_007487 [Morchella sextelata]
MRSLFPHTGFVSYFEAHKRDRVAAAAEACTGNLEKLTCSLLSPDHPGTSSSRGSSKAYSNIWTVNINSFCISQSCTTSENCREMAELQRTSTIIQTSLDCHSYMEMDIQTHRAAKALGTTLFITVSGPSASLGQQRSCGIGAGGAIRNISQNEQPSHRSLTCTSLEEFGLDTLGANLAGRIGLCLRLLPDIYRCGHRSSCIFITLFNR